MKPDDLRELAANPRFVIGIYNYCDCWCERCSLSQRCLNFAMQQAEADANLEARDLLDPEFWSRLQQMFHNTIEMLQAEATARGMNLDAAKSRTSAPTHAGNQRISQNQPLARAAMAYAKTVDQWLADAKPLLEAKLAELTTEITLEIGDPQTEVSQLSEFTDIIQWYQYFIFVKLRRAIESRDQAEQDVQDRQLSKDSDGSAKVALIGMDRSIAAWAGLRTALGADETDSILGLLAQLAALRRETEKLFPQARAFRRPGFDTEV